MTISNPISNPVKLVLEFHRVRNSFSSFTDGKKNFTQWMNMVATDSKVKKKKQNRRKHNISAYNGSGHFGLDSVMTPQEQYGVVLCLPSSFLFLCFYEYVATVFAR